MPVPMKDYVDVIGKGLQAEIDRRFTDLHRQIDQARDQMETRLNGMNEFRQSLSDLSGQMVPRNLLDHIVEEMAGIHLRLQGDIDKINTSLAQSKGKQAAYATAIALVISLATILVYLFNGSIIHVK
jgi:hypothetical protein